MDKSFSNLQNSAQIDVAAVVSGLLGDLEDAAAILAIVIFNAVELLICLRVSTVGFFAVELQKLLFRRRKG